MSVDYSTKTRKRFTEHGIFEALLRDIGWVSYADSGGLGEPHTVPSCKNCEHGRIDAVRGVVCRKYVMSMRVTPTGHCDHWEAQ
jgi:hypothetical protein